MIRGLTEREIRNALGFADVAAYNLADARLALTGSPSSATFDRARMLLEDVRRQHDHMRQILNEALLLRAECPACGDGYGVIAVDVEGKDIACPKCVTA